MIAVIVCFDDPSVGNLQKIRYKDVCKGFEEQNGCPIFRSTLRTPGKATNSMNSHGASVKISQFPLRLSFASTGHKLQGTGIKSDLVAHGYTKKGKPQPVPKCLYYVMLSRCTSIDHIFLDKDFDLNQIQCSPKALQESERLTARSLNNEIEKDKCDFFFMNVRSFSKHAEDLLSDLHAKQARYICLAETWIDCNKATPFERNDKFVYHASFGNGKGSCIISNNEETILFPQNL